MKIKEMHYVEPLLKTFEKQNSECPEEWNLRLNDNCPLTLDSGLRTPDFGLVLVLHSHHANSYRMRSQLQ